MEASIARPIVGQAVWTFAKEKWWIFDGSSFESLSSSCQAQSWAVPNTAKALERPQLAQREMTGITSSLMPQLAEGHSPRRLQRQTPIRPQILLLSAIRSKTVEKTEPHAFGLSFQAPTIFEGAVGSDQVLLMDRTKSDGGSSSEMCCATILKVCRNRVDANGCIDLRCFNQTTAATMRARVHSAPMMRHSTSHSPPVQD